MLYYNSTVRHGGGLKGLRKSFKENEKKLLTKLKQYDMIIELLLKQESNKMNLDN